MEILPGIWLDILLKPMAVFVAAVLLLVVGASLPPLLYLVAVKMGGG